MSNYQTSKSAPDEITAEQWTIEMESKKFGPHVTVTRGGYITLEIAKESPVGLQSWEFCDEQFTRDDAQRIGEATAAWLAALPRPHRRAIQAAAIPPGFESLADDPNLHCEEKREHGHIADALQCNECMLIMCAACAAGHYASDHPNYLEDERETGK